MWVYLLQLQSLVICIYDRKKKKNNNKIKVICMSISYLTFFFSLFTKYKINKIKN